MKLTHSFLAASAAHLHVSDDATLHREPGMAIADLLTGAGALAAVLAVAATALPRLRAGSPATAAGRSRTIPRTALAPAA